MMKKVKPVKMLGKGAGGGGEAVGLTSHSRRSERSHFNVIMFEDYRARRELFDVD